VGAVASRMKERNGQLTQQQAENVGIFLERLPSKTLQLTMCLHCNRAGSKQWEASEGRRRWIANNAELLCSMNK